MSVIDEHLKKLDPAEREALERIRTIVKGTLQFTVDNQIPEDTIKEIIQIRLNSIPNDEGKKLWQKAYGRTCINGTEQRIG